MADDDTTNTHAHQQPRGPSPDLRNLGDKLVGSWEVSGGTQGMVRFE
jgi:hypothetical protein